jgi:hypothetical protein
MAFNRRERILHHQKQNKVIESVGVPRDAEGDEGEQRYCRISTGLYLFVKSGGRWYNTSTGQRGTTPAGQAGAGYVDYGGTGGSAGSGFAVSFQPHYDTGWLVLAANAYTNITHGLNCLMPLIQVWFKDPNSKIHLVSNYLDVDDNKGFGLWTIDSTQVQLYSGDTHLFEYENASLNSGAAEAFTTGHYRIFFWNTGITS